MKIDFKSLSDSELTVLLKTESKLAFEEVYSRYWKTLYYTAHKIIKTEESTEEIVQDVFLVLWKKRSTLNIESLNKDLASMKRYSVYKF